jgi:hypothetical protein
MKLALFTALAVATGMPEWEIHGQIYDTNNVVVQTFVGSGFKGYVDGQGTQTMFNNPSAVISDSAGSLFVWDQGNYRIRKVTVDGTVSTFAGGGTGALPGYGTSIALPSTIDAMTIDHSNVVWLASGSVLLRMTRDAYVSKAFTFTNFTGLESLSGLCVDSENNLYCATWGGNQIYRLKPDGFLEVFAGSGNFGSVDGNGIFDSFEYPAALIADAADNIYVSDAQGSLIRKINQNRDVVTVAGQVSGGLLSDGVGTNARFSYISGMWVDDFGNVILACDSSVRRMSPTSNVTTLAGSFSQRAYTNGPGNLARFNGASGVCISQGTIFVADSNNQRIRSISLNSTAQPVLPASLQLHIFPGLQITGTLGRTYQIQSSTDMNNWNTVATLLLTTSPYEWIDPNPMGGSKFYRALLLP